MKILFTFLTTTALFALDQQAGAFAPARSSIAINSKTALGMGLLSRFRKKKEILLDPIEIGASIPEIDVQIMSSDDVNEGEIVPVSIREALGDGTSILVGMPGAFTKTCSGTHLPGYIKQSGKLNELGVDTIAVVTTNDKFVNGAWAKEFGLDEEKLSSNDDDEGSSSESSPVKILSDGDGELVRELGLVEDMGFGVGIRSKRFALVVEDGVAKHLETDDGMEDCFNTSAENLVQILTPPPVVKVEETEEEVDQKSTVLFLTGLALACLFSYASGDHTTIAATTSVTSSPPTVIPAVAGKAAKTSFDLLNTYR